MVMQQPGDRILSELLQGNPLDGRQLGQAILQILPALPHEGPPGMPRGMAKQLFPAGFLRQQPALPEVPPTIVAPPAVPAAPPPNQGNHPRPPAPAPAVVRTQVIPQPAPAGGYRSAAQGGEPISVARSQRVRIHERAGM